MTLERIPEKFNIEKFKEDFQIVLQKFVDTTEAVRDRSRDDDNRNDEEYRKEKEDTYKAELEKILPMALNALKKSDNKQEVIENMSKIFWEVELKNSTGSYPEEIESPISVYVKADFFEKVILNLLNSK